MISVPVRQEERHLAIQFFIADSLGEIDAQADFVTFDENTATVLHELAQRYSLDDSVLHSIDPYEVTCITVGQVMGLQALCDQLRTLDRDDSPIQVFLTAFQKLCVAAIRARRPLLAVGD